jgi:kinetochor protein Mis14/NSL1
MDPYHRKIDLQSPQDLTYLLNNINAAAQQKLDIHFPPSAAPKGEEDAFRKKVETLVSQVRLLLPSPSPALAKGTKR